MMSDPLGDSLDTANRIIDRLTAERDALAEQLEEAPVYGDRVRVECPRCDALGTTVDHSTGLGVVCACGGSGVILARYVPLDPKSTEENDS